MRVSQFLAISVLAFSAAPAMSAECAVEITANDQMQYSTKEIKAPKECKEFSVTLKHVGKLASNVMGHNWVLSTDKNMQGVVSDAMAAGPVAHYLKAGDSRVVAATKMLGGGESDVVKVDMSKISPDEKYIFYCTFPGHSAIMKGTFALAP